MVFSSLPPQTNLAPALVVGQGELGGVFSLGLLKLGVSVTPLLRRSDMASIVAAHPRVSLCIVTVGEADLASVLDGPLRSYASNLVLVQNELRPAVWEKRGLPEPTVAVVWFEKKPGRVARPLLSTPVYGPHAVLVTQLLERQGLAAHVEPERERLQFELALKNIYILVTNACGVAIDSDVGTLLHQHPDLLERVFNDAFELEQALLGMSLPSTALRLELTRALEAEPRHACAGRSAPLRLQHALEAARQLGLSTPALDALALPQESR